MSVSEATGSKQRGSALRFLGGGDGGETAARVESQNLGLL